MTGKLSSAIPAILSGSPASVVNADTSAAEFEFYGRHLVASYLRCSMTALLDEQRLLNVMQQAAVASGATVISCAHHSFPNAGMTAVMLLAESHASIHTYPEHATCFVDIFTCGHDCHPERFDQVLRAFLLPEKVTSKFILRDHRTEEA